MSVTRPNVHNIRGDLYNQIAQFLRSQSYNHFTVEEEAERIAELMDEKAETSWTKALERVGTIILRVQQRQLIKMMGKYRTWSRSSKWRIRSTNNTEAMLERFVVLGLASTESRQVPVTEENPTGIEVAFRLTMLGLTLLDITIKSDAEDAANGTTSAVIEDVEDDEDDAA